MRKTERVFRIFGRLQAGLALLLAAAPLSSFGDDAVHSALVVVQSQYQDDLTGKPVTLRGHGFLARIDGKVFVICDSHLSQGKHVLLRSSSGTALSEPQQRLADNDDDLEMIEIRDPGIRPIFEYSNERRRLEIQAPEFVNSHPDASSGYIQIAEDSFVPVSLKLHDQPIPYQTRSWDQSPGYGDPLESFHKEGGLSMSWMNWELFSDSRIVRGMSGGPLLVRDDEDDKIVVAGLAKSFHNRLLRSYFSTASQIRGLVDAFARGARGNVSKTAWKYRGTTYRDLGDGTLEINPELRPSGGELTDGGGESTDGGETLAPAPPFRAGMQYHGESVLGFQVGPVAHFANRAGLRAAEEAAADHHLPMTPLSEKDVDFGALIKDRLSRSPEAKVAFANWACLIDETSLLGSNIRIQIREPGTGQSVRVELDRRGMIPADSPKPYDPMLQLPVGEANEKVMIDTRGLFFFDPSQITFNDEEFRRRPDAFALRARAASMMIWKPGEPAQNLVCARTRTLAAPQVRPACDPGKSSPNEALEHALQNASRIAAQVLHPPGGGR